MSEHPKLADLKHIMFGSVFCEACSQDITDGPVTAPELEKILKEHQKVCER
jgi:hypothetical protein